MELGKSGVRLDLIHIQLDIELVLVTYITTHIFLIGQSLGPLNCLFVIMLGSNLSRGFWSKKTLFSNFSTEYWIKGSNGNTFNNFWKNAIAGINQIFQKFCLGENVCIEKNFVNNWAKIWQKDSILLQVIRPIRPC